MRVLVTGGAGYVGTAVVAALLKRGDQVTVLDRLVFGCPYAAPRLGLEVWQGDVRDDTALDALVPGHDAVVHLAFASNDPLYELDPRTADAINLAPTRSLLQRASRAGVRRFVFLSSCSVYGRALATIVDECTPPSPLTDYARHKLYCEGMVGAEAVRSGLVCTILRPATACGRSARQRLDLLLNRLIVRAVVRREVEVADATASRPVVTLADLAEAVCHVLAIETAPGPVPIYNVVTRTETIEHWARLVCAIAGQDVRVHLSAMSASDTRSYRANCARLRSAGFRSVQTVRAGLRELAHALRQGKLPDALSNPAYINLAIQKAHDFGRDVPLRRVI